MRQALLLGGALAAIVSAGPLMAAADDYNATGVVLIAEATMGGEVDAGKLVGKEVYDGNGDKVGEVDSVMVDPEGKVSSVVLDVSGWLEGEKLVAITWTDLKTDPDGKIVSSLTKDSAEAAEAYTYKDKSLRGQVMTESGEPYAANDAPAETTAGATATTTEANAADMKTDDPLVNADESLNASKLIGMDVQSPEDQKVGDIGEVVLDKEGNAAGIVVDVGGFLGIATHPVLLDWKDVTLTSQDGKSRAVVNLTKDKLEQMPTYESSSE